MRDPTQEEIDVVTSVSMCDQHEAVAVIQALDAHRGECVPVDKLKARIEELWGGVVPNPMQSLFAWISRRGWLNGDTKEGGSAP